MRLLTLEEWATCIALDEMGSVIGAAHQLGVTQSAVSHRMAKMERKMGCRLWYRYARSVEATLAGATLLVAAQNALPGLALAEASVTADDLPVMYRPTLQEAALHRLRSAVSHIERVIDQAQVA